MAGIRQEGEEIRKKYQHTFDYSAGKMIYIGIAEPGSSKDKPVWQIRKFIRDVDGNIIDSPYADNSLAFDKVWDNRATYSYV